VKIPKKLRPYQLKRQAQFSIEFKIFLLDMSCDPLLEKMQRYS